MPIFKISEGTRRELEKFKEYMRENEYTVTTVTGYWTYLSRFLRQVGLPQAGTLQELCAQYIYVSRETKRLATPRFPH